MSTNADQSQVQYFVIAAGKTDFPLQAAGTAFELVSVFPFGYAIRIQPDKGDPDIYFSGEGDTPEKPFNQLLISHDVYPATVTQALTVGIRIVKGKHISRIQRTRDLEVAGFGWGQQTITTGNTLALDIFHVSGSLLPGFYPPQWSLQQKSITIVCTSAAATVAAADAGTGVYVLLDGSAGVPLIQGVPVTIEMCQIASVINLTAGSVNIFAHQEFYMYP